MPALAKPIPGPGGFDDITIASLDAMTPAEFDALPFGVVGLAPSGEVEIYNAAESGLTGLAPDTVLGRPFFGEIGRCMNNHLVAHRFRDEPDLDTTLDYVLTFRMKVTPARLRMLRRADLRRRYLLVQR